MDKYILQNLINHISHAIFWKDCDLVIRGCNKLFAENLGFTNPKEIIGKTDFDVLPIEAAIKYRIDDQEVIKSGEAKLDYEENFIQPDGSIRTVLVSKVPFYDDKLNIIGILGVYNDISQRKKEEQQLKNAMDEVQAASSAKDEFIRNMSHDIRTPLSGIIGMSNILEKIVKTEEEKEYAHMINISSEQLLALLNGVLDIVAIGSQKENQLNMSTFNLVELIQGIADLESPTLQLKNLTLKIVISKDVPIFIETDQTKLHRILLNLLGNAVKFTQKGSIEIKIKKKEKKGKTVQLEFGIKDSGSGIKSEDKKKIFNRFYRGTPSYQGIYAGHGVGLHIVKQYTELLKGKIQVESDVNKGSTFTLTIPVKIPKQSAIQQVSQQNESKELTTNGSIIFNIFDNIPYILLIEDNAIALKTVESIFNQIGLRYETATNGANALELFKKYRFDMVITDIGLPDISGVELTKQFRLIEKQLNYKITPVIGLTAHSINEVEKESLQAGMNKVMTKPIRIAQLNELLKQYCPNNFIENSESEFTSYPLLNSELGINTLGSKKNFINIIELLISDNESDFQLIEKAWQEKDYSTIQRLAHKMKSSAIYCGTERMRYACEALEHHFKHQKSGDTESLYKQFCVVHKDTLDTLVLWLKEYGI